MMLAVFRLMRCVSGKHFGHIKMAAKNKENLRVKQRFYKGKMQQKQGVKI